MNAPTAHLHGDQGVDSVADVAHRHPSLVVVGRAGWLAKGVVYTLAGVLAASIAFSDSDRPAPAQQGGAAGGQEASQTGAVARIADSSAGKAALYVLAAGLLLYVLWRIVTILLPAENTAKVWATRVGYTISAITYAVLAWSAISLAQSPSSDRPSENSRVERATASVLEHTGGRWVVGIVGVGVVVLGLFFAKRAVKADFTDELEPRDVGPVRHRAIVQLGRVGWIGRALMMALIGGFLVRAAVVQRADEAEGLDGALRRVVDNSWGPPLVVAVGVGLALYGIYCIVSSPIHRLTPAD